MQKKFTALLCSAIFAVSFFASTNAEAQSGKSGFHTELSFKPIWSERNDYLYTGHGGAFEGDGQINSESTIGFDLRTQLGFLYSGWGFVGLGLNYLQVSTTRGATDAVNSKDSSRKTLEYGPSVGYVGNAWRFIFTYLISGTRDVTDKAADNVGGVTANLDYTHGFGSGYQATLGYQFRLSQTFTLGPSLVYRKVSYKSQTKTNHLNAADSYTDRAYTTPLIEADLQPFVTVIGTF